MKLVILNYEYPPLGGGAGNATYYLLREFADVKGLEIDLVTSSTGRYRKDRIAGNVRVHFLDIGKKGNLHYQANRELLVYAWKSYNYAKKLIKQRKPDLVHAFFGIPCGYVAMQLGLPYIVSLRGSDVPFYNERFEMEDRLIFKNLSRGIWKRARAVVANSKGLKELAQKTAPSLDIEVIFNGVDTAEFAPGKAKKNEGKLRIVSSGRLIRRKGFEYLLEALKGSSEFELVFMGDGDRKEFLREMARDFGVDAKFLGVQPKNGVVENLRRADVFVMPSLNEGMSNSVLEALACGLPVISTDVGGCEELVIHGKNGFVVKKADPKALSEALDMYLQNRYLISKHSEESRRIAQTFGWGDVGRRYLELYSRVLG